jgi:hypothetical protein
VIKEQVQGQEQGGTVGEMLAAGIAGGAGKLRDHGGFVACDA